MVIENHRRKTQRKIENATWIDDRRMTIIHGKCWLARFGATFFLLAGLTFAALPFAVPREGKEVSSAIFGLGFGLPIIVMGLGFLMWRMYRVIDLDSETFDYGSMLFHRKSDNSVPLRHIKRVRIHSHDVARYGVNHAVYLEGHSNGETVSVYLHEFPNNLPRAKEFCRTVTALIKKSRRLESTN